MKAVLCREFGPIEKLRIEDIDSPAARAGELLLRVEACGVNFYDGLAVQGNYQVKPPFPFSPGGEVAGEVIAAGEGVTGFHPGQRVMAFTGFGGYAEAIAVPAAHAFLIPDGMDYEAAAGFLIAYATSHHALKDRALLKSGETLLVLGAAGGVGLTAVEIGKAMGARVIAAASSAEKLTLAKSYSAAETINYAKEDLRERVKVLTDGRGVDVVYDPVGGKQSEAAMRSLALFGRHLVIGFASGGIPSVALNHLLLKQVAVIGVLWGNFARAEPRRNADNIAELLAWYQDGRLKPHISESHTLAHFLDGLGRVMSRQAQGKVVIRPNARAAT
jgi:NADPH:quinone reductase